MYVWGVGKRVDTDNFIDKCNVRVMGGSGGGTRRQRPRYYYFDFGLSIQLVVTCAILMTSITKRPKDEQRTEGMVDLNLSL